MAIKDLTQIETHLFFCNGGTCKNKGAEQSTAQIRAIIGDLGLSEKVHTTKTLCNGRCKDGPIVISQPDGIWFKQISTDHAELFVNEYLLKGRTPQQLRLYGYGETQMFPVSPELTVSAAKNEKI